jgi:hypothetical protein
MTLPFNQQFPNLAFQFSPFPVILLSFAAPRCYHRSFGFEPQHANRTSRRQKEEKTKGGGGVGQPMTREEGVASSTLEAPCVFSSLQPRNSTLQFLISVPAIRIQRNSNQISRLRISNRHERRFVHPGRFCGRRPLHPGRFCGTAPRCKRISRHQSAGSGSSSNLQHPTSNLQLLIGPPVIRIRSNSFRIRENSNSNRHKMRFFWGAAAGLGDERIKRRRFSAAAAHPLSGGQCASEQPAPTSSHSTLATSHCLVLIGPPVIRIHPNLFRISTDSRSNRHEIEAFV